MPPTKICDKEVPACVSIDSTKDDALCDARQAFPNTGRHSNAQTAVDNMIECVTTSVTAKGVMLIGHGQPGIIILGKDTFTSDFSAYIGHDNISAWLKHIKKIPGLKKITEIIFCSCNTGAGKPGTALVHRVAKESGAMTFAFTGIISITARGEVSCQPGKWQIGDPKDSLARKPIYPSTHSLGGNGMDNIALIHEDKLRVIDAAEISSLTFYQSADKQRGQQIVSLQGRDAEAILGLIDFSARFELKGEPLAPVTGQFELEYLIDGEVKQKNFIVYNNLVARDANYPQTFYPISPDLAGVLLHYITLR